MTTLVCFDPKAGTLRRYKRGATKPVCTGLAVYDPWMSLPESGRTVSAGDIEAFRTQPSITSGPVAA